MTNNKKSKVSLTVSLVTIHQLGRKECIKLLADHITKQTYQNIIEWVIVEGSSTKEQADENAGHVEALRSLCTRCPIVYLPFSGNKLGELRNMGNRACQGDITVCMDDDDYYFPTRVEHAVNKLSKSPYLIAGCSDKYMYDYCLDMMVKFKDFGPYHSLNDCMAWKKEYLLTHAHDPELSRGEEASFTKDFTEPMVQLDPNHCIVSSSHRFNTYNKKEICIQIRNKIYPYGDEIKGNPMPSKMLVRYKKLFCLAEPIESPHDIVYFTGGRTIPWSPEDQSLGGSEQAIVNLSKEWAAAGKRVAVYGRVPNMRCDEVDYKDWKTFDWQMHYNTVILWRFCGVNDSLHFSLKAREIFIDYHDNHYRFTFDYASHVHKVSKLFFKSEYHRECYEKLFAPHPSVIIPNGLRLADFSTPPPGTPARNPYRFCYCSSYDRGLLEILAYIWYFIFEAEPLAELHVYYGMDLVQDEEFKESITFLMGQRGVMDHGRQPVDAISREKHLSTFHMYITDTKAEIDCISIRESLVTGCIPLLSNSELFKDRDGLHFDLDRGKLEGYKAIAEQIVKVMRMPEFLERCREKFRDSPTIVGWSDVAKLWIDYM